MAPREVVLGLDRLERGGSLFGAALALVSSSLVVFVLMTKVAKLAVPKSKVCPAYYHLAHGFCERTTFSQILPEYVAALVLGLMILYFALRRKRAGVIVSSLVLAAMLGILSAGIFFAFLGVWLMLRAWRLNRYGVANFSAVSRIQRERAQAKREGRAPRSNSEILPSAPARVVAPPASKRYTPKKQQRTKK